ncbi:MAG TPA: hypothetical protein VN929_19560 [Burkholderiales bacterium]|nr:hypothetical protein [Burkholderiales bacterium]
MRLRLALSLAALAACHGCAGGSQLSKPGATQAILEQDRQHCLGMMYSDRIGRGRMAPNWWLYEYCMTGRGYVRQPII